MNCHKETPVMLHTHNGKTFSSDTLTSLINSLMGMEYFIDDEIELIDWISIHTFEITKRVSMIEFHETYGRLRAYIYARAKKSIKFGKLKSSFPFDPKYQSFTTNSNSKSNSKSHKRYRSKTIFRFFPTVNVCYGIRMFLYYFDNIGTIKLIVDPSLLIASCKSDFNPDKYDYTKLDKRDKDFWGKLNELLRRFMISWDITRYGDHWILTRVDVTANIRIGKYISIPKLIRYYKRSLKRYGYKNVKFHSFDMNNHIFECKNLSQNFTIYDKTHEQYIHYNRTYQHKVLRMEYKIRSKRLYGMKRQLHRYGLTPSNPRYFNILYAISLIAPIIMYNAIRNIFKSGDFYSRKALHKLLKRDKTCGDSIKREVTFFMESLSAESSYDDIVDFISKYKDDYGYYKLYRNLRYLKTKKISPIILEDLDAKRSSKLPGVQSLFLSAIINGHKTGSSDEFDYIWSLAAELMLNQ